MKKIILSLFILLPSLAMADGGPFGLGVIINSPTGFSGKYRFSQETSVDFALGYSFARSDNISLHSTYLWETNKGFKVSKIFIGYYFGVGGAFFSRDRNDPPPSWAKDDPNEETGLAVRGVGGLNYYFNHPAIEVFTEISLHFFFIPSTDVDFNIAIGGRYYF